jgi:hypothetical protein
MTKTSTPFIWHIPCIIDREFTTLNQQNAEIGSLDIYITISHWISPHVSVCKGPSSGYQTKKKQHKTKLVTVVHSWRGVKRARWLKCRHCVKRVSVNTVVNTTKFVSSVGDMLVITTTYLYIWVDFQQVSCVAASKEWYTGWCMYNRDLLMMDIVMSETCWGDDVIT